MWNKRRANSLLFLEIVLAFLVLFAVYTFVTLVVNRSSSELGYAYEDGLLVSTTWSDDLDSLAIIELQGRLQREVAGIDGVEAAGFISYVQPFRGNTWQNAHNDNGFEISFKLFFGDRFVADAAQIEVSEGRWFNEEDDISKYRSVVVNRAFQEEYFPHSQSLIDTVIHTNGETRIIGVVEDFKYFSNFAEREPIVMMTQRGNDLSFSAFKTLWVRTAPGRKGAVQEDIYNAVTQVTKQPRATISDLEKMRTAANRPTLLPLIIFALIALFLLINAALGLFGVLFTQINRRRAEIGLRKALGATPGEITSQFVMEVFLVAAAGLLVGSFFAIQLPLLDILPLKNKFAYYGILLAALTILLVVGVCALLPSLQASRLHPASVLHEE